MAMSLVPQMIPEQRMRTVTIEEILALGEQIESIQPPLEHYFSPTRREMFIKDYRHYLNTSLLEAKHGHLDLDLYLVFVLSFQFTSPLLEIPVNKELDHFFHILEHHYNVNELTSTFILPLMNLKRGWCRRKMHCYLFARNWKIPMKENGK